MLGAPATEQPQQLVFAVMDGVNLSTLSNAIDTLRLANRVAERALYTWLVATHAGGPALTSSGIEVAANAALRDLPEANLVALVAGVDAHKIDSPELAQCFRRLAARGADLGGIETAPHLLARWGLLDGHACTIHWSEAAAFMEANPEITMTGDLFEIDRQRFTCAGAAATVDMLITMVRRQHGGELAGRIADQMMHERVRDEHDRQRAPLPARLGVNNRKLISVVQVMEANLEAPVNREDLARSARLSTRQLERLFRCYLGRSPARYYLELRLDHARRLLMQTDLSVLEIALASGFVSASHFTKCFRDRFGRTPRIDRTVAPGVSPDLALA